MLYSQLLHRLHSGIHPNWSSRLCSDASRHDLKPSRSDVDSATAGPVPRSSTPCGSSARGRNRDTCHAYSSHHCTSSCIAQKGLKRYNSIDECRVCKDVKCFTHARPATGRKRLRPGTHKKHRQLARNPYYQRESSLYKQHSDGLKEVCTHSCIYACTRMNGAVASGHMQLGIWKVHSSLGALAGLVQGHCLSVHARPSPDCVLHCPPFGNCTVPSAMFGGMRVNVAGAE